MKNLQHGIATGKSKSVRRPLSESLYFDHSKAGKHCYFFLRSCICRTSCTSMMMKIPITANDI